MKMKTSKIFFSLAGIVVLSAAVLLLSACGKDESVNTGEAKGRISVKSDPEGASVYVGSLQELGTAPGEYSVPAGIYLLRIEKDGYAPRWVKTEVKPDETSDVQVKLEAQTASILITCNPTGAMVTIDGEEKGPAPYILSGCPQGTYDVSVALNNYKPDSRKLVVPLERTMPDSPFELHFDLIDDTGSIKLNTNPEGASILIDGNLESAKTPATILRLKEGAHKVRFEMKGFDPVETTVNVERGKMVETDTVSLAARAGMLELTVKPAGAKITVDQNEISDLSKPIELSAGEHKIQVSKDGYDPVARAVTIRSEETLKQIITLERNTGEIRFLVNPPGVFITLDGRLIGMSQPEKAGVEIARQFHIAGLPIGKHKLRFTHPRAAKPVVKEFTISGKGESKDLGKIDLWVPNVNLTVISTKRIYPEGRIIPTAADSDEIIYEPEPSIRNTYKKSEVRIEYLPGADVSDPRFKTSSVDLSGAEDDDTGKTTGTGVIRFNSLPAGSEVFIDGESKGKAENGIPFEVRDLEPGAHSIKIAHKYGKNTKNMTSNAVTFKKPVDLKAGETQTIPAPPILWVADQELFLKDGSRIPQCRVVENDGSDEIIVETAPGKSRKIKRSDIAKRKQLKD